MSISKAEAIRKYFDDPDNNSFKPTVTEMKELIKDKVAYEELATLCAAELHQDLDKHTK